MRTESSQRLDEAIRLAQGEEPVEGYIGMLLEYTDCQTC
jgi:hypothetical protein